MKPSKAERGKAEELLLMALDQTKVEWNEHGKKKLHAIASALAEAREEGSEKWHKAGWKDGIEEAAKVMERRNK